MADSIHVGGSPCDTCGAHTVEQCKSCSVYKSMQQGEEEEQNQ